MVVALESSYGQIYEYLYRNFTTIQILNQEQRRLGIEKSV